MTDLRCSPSTRALACSLVVLVAAGSAAAEETAPLPAWYERVATRLETTWNEGKPELYLPLHTYHLRSAYSREQIDSFNEKPWGLGIGKGAYDETGDWHGLFVVEFQDSHFKPEYMAGYGYKTFWRMAGELKFGLGYNAFITSRSDIGHYTPIPLVLPIASLEYSKFSLDSTYVPGRKGNGNILFFWGKMRF